MAVFSFSNISVSL